MKRGTEKAWSAANRAAMGTVVFASARNLENVLELCVWSFLFEGSEDEEALGEIVTSNLNLQTKLDLFGALFLFRYGERREALQLKSVVKRVEQAQAARNALVHGSYIRLNAVDRHVNRRSRRDGLKKKEVELDATRLRAVARQIDDATLAVWNLGLGMPLGLTADLV